ncbi:LPXTG cell wall anchor domain-containing protein [uncultured Vagococcus sp.]|uniref:LPXTG cell wall anchor domain-containing protein n=1 Tax=uncultured Vagococcus sp. TaxID=189676 RepID=UPI0028D1A05E|nr:LPXTG cell wall anchor domain-containing protein [uncultured Vagococcus sp.]
MRKQIKALKGIIGGLLLSMLVSMPIVADASSLQPLPQTGEEIAKTGLVIGGIIIVVVILIILIRRRKK